MSAVVAACNLPPLPLSLCWVEVVAIDAVCVFASACTSACLGGAEGSGRYLGGAEEQYVQPGAAGMKQTRVHTASHTHSLCSLVLSPLSERSLSFI